MGQRCLVNANGRGERQAQPASVEFRLKEPAMPAIDPDDLPKKKILHEMGQDLSLLSIGELTERVELLKEEIARLEAEMNRKRATRSAADIFFKK
jgi:uncharacterized small protein (DUF1192 family)